MRLQPRSVTSRLSDRSNEFGELSRMSGQYGSQASQESESEGLMWLGSFGTWLLRLGSLGRGRSDLRLPGSPDDLRWWKFHLLGYSKYPGRVLTFFLHHPDSGIKQLWYGLVWRVHMASMRQPSKYSWDRSGIVLAVLWCFIWVGCWWNMSCWSEVHREILNTSQHLFWSDASYAGRLFGVFTRFGQPMRSAGLKPSVTGRRQNDPTGDGVHRFLVMGMVYGGHINHSLTWSGHSRILLITDIVT